MAKSQKPWKTKRACWASQCDKKPASSHSQYVLAKFGCVSSKMVGSEDAKSSKVSFSVRYMGPKNPAKTACQKKVRKMAQQKMHRFLLLNSFACIWRPFFGTTTPENKAAQKRQQTQNPQKRNVFASFGPPAGSIPNKKQEKEGPQTTKTRPRLPISAFMRVSTRVARETFGQLLTRRKAPIFLAFSPRRLASGSLSVFCGLLVSCFLAVFSTVFGPLLSPYIYIYIYIYFFFL